MRRAEDAGKKVTLTCGAGLAAWGKGDARAGERATRWGRLSGPRAAGLARESAGLLSARAVGWAGVACGLGRPGRERGKWAWAVGFAGLGLSPVGFGFGLG